MYTEHELRTVRRSFGHPSIRAAENLFKRAERDGCPDTETRNCISKIQADSKVCLETATPPSRFKLTIGMDELRFNKRVQVDTMFLENLPVLHLVDKSTPFTAESILKDQSAAEICRTMQRVWNFIHLGPPDILWVDQGSSYVSEEFIAYLDSSEVVLLETAVECPGTIVVVERYHSPLRLRSKDCGRICLRMRMIVSACRWLFMLWTAR